jgi:hypothetical protein
MQLCVTCVVRAHASTTLGQQTTYDLPTPLAHYWQPTGVATADEVTSLCNALGCDEALKPV